MDKIFDMVESLSEQRKSRLRSMIVSTYGILGGRCRLVNTRLSVDDIVRLYLNDEFDDYPYLNKEECFNAAILHIYEN